MSTEKETQKAIIQYLKLKKIFHWRQNSGTFKTDRGGFYSMGVVGAPDIFCVRRGQCIGIEVKDVKGKQNDNQIQFQKDFEKAGGQYILAKSLDDITNIL